MQNMRTTDTRAGFTLGSGWNSQMRVIVTVWCAPNRTATDATIPTASFALFTHTHHGNAQLPPTYSLLCGDHLWKRRERDT